MKNVKLNRFNSENENENAAQQNEQQVENKSTWQKIKKPVIITAAVAAIGAGMFGLYKVGKKALTKKQAEVEDSDFEDPDKKEDNK